MVEYCEKINSKVFAHGATGKGNDQVRFELSAAVLAPDYTVIAPWRDAEFRKEFPGRKEMIEYAEKHNIPVINLTHQLKGQDPSSLIVNKLDAHPSIDLHHKVGVILKNMILCCCLCLEATC